MSSLTSLLQQADSLRFKLLAIVGRDREKKNQIIDQLQKADWILVDVGKELFSIWEMLSANGQDNSFEIGTRIKEWFAAKPNNLILVNAGILYHDQFLKVSPVGAFKYNSRNKNCVLFLEDESKLGLRIYYGDIGTNEYFDQEINDILLVDIKDIEDTNLTTESYQDKKALNDESIAHLFQFHQIKDVIDIDSDLKDQNKRLDLVSSYILSSSLEEQIVDFFENLEKPVHNARNIIGNYGSGKSHLVGFLSSLVENPELAELVRSSAIQQAVKRVNRKFYLVQFELQSGQVELKAWFYGKVRKQLKEKYALEIPIFDPIKDYDDKENIQAIIELIKEQDSTAGLVVIIDEVSDFLSGKQKQDMKADLQFLRVLGQVCQDQDFMFIGSMQEDVFTSPKFKDVATEIGRVSERFQNIIIHKEDVKKVISMRIVPKTAEQRHRLEKKMSIFADKIEPVKVGMDDYIDLFPLTPFLLEMFSNLPYFEKRGVIQFAISQIRQKMFEPFPYFLTFELIYDLLASNPNKKNLEEIYEITKVMSILEQKVQLLEYKYRQDALKVIKALAVYSLWDQKGTGVTGVELANSLMLLPAKKIFSASDHVELVIKKIREVTDGQYIKSDKPQDSETTYFRFEKKAGADPEEKIRQKAAAVSNDEIENEFFTQFYDLLELERLDGHTDIFLDECAWPSVKSFRTGLVYFTGRNSRFQDTYPKDYALVIISPFVADFVKKIHERQINIHFQIPSPESVELFKEVVAIRSLINSNFMPVIMAKKLEDRLSGYKQGQIIITGLRYRLAKLLINHARCSYNGIEENIKHHLGKDLASVPEIIDTLKTGILDKEFTEYYHAHPVYSSHLSSANIVSTCSNVCQDLASGNFQSMGKSTKLFLERLKLLNAQGYPDYHGCQMANMILDIVKSKGSKVTDIQKDIVDHFSSSRFGLEPEIVYVYLIFFVVQGKLFLQARGGEKWDINNIREKFRNVSQFESILYARLSHDMSYDFAERLLNTLGLNGARIRIEKERIVIFSQYKQKVAEILRDLNAIEAFVKDLTDYSRIYLDIKSVSDELSVIQEIPWKTLDIENFTRFGTIEHLNSHLPTMELRLRSIANLNDALRAYKKYIHNDLLYMDEAIKLIDEHPILNFDHSNTDKLRQICYEIKELCSNFDKYSDKSQRNPIKGKSQNFKKIYKYEVYIPAHDKYVGKKIDWSILDKYHSHPDFIKIQMLFALKHLSGYGIFQARIAEWLELKKFKCMNPTLDQQLDSGVFCRECLLPQREGYVKIPKVLKNIELDIESMFEQVQKNVVKLVREYRDNIQYLEEEEQALIQNILDRKSLPEEFPPGLVPAINNLLREVEVVELSRDDLMEKLFPGNQLVSISELNDSFAMFINDLKKDRDDSSVRIRLR